MGRKRIEGRLSQCAAALSMFIFPASYPALYNRLIAGEDNPVDIEVITHLNAQNVRGILWFLPKDWRAGTQVLDTGKHFHVPVGERVLGRMFNVFGETIDRKGSIDRWRMAFHSPVTGASHSPIHPIRGF
jgi:F-type H+/Na+-transporting ATPase subunit beta